MTKRASSGRWSICWGATVPSWTLAGVNALLASEVEYVYFLARPALAAVSSTLVRDVIRHQGPLDKLVPAPVVKALQKG